EKGYLPEAIVNYLALIGWSPGNGDELLPIDEMARRFSLDGVGHSAGVFDEEKLAWVNRHYLKMADPARIAELSVPYFHAAGVKMRTGQKARALFHPIRIVLTGLPDGPELDLAVPAIDRGADLPLDAGLPAILGCRERAAEFMRCLGA